MRCSKKWIGILHKQTLETPRSVRATWETMCEIDVLLVFTVVDILHRYRCQRAMQPFKCLFVWLVYPTVCSSNNAFVPLNGWQREKSMHVWRSAVTRMGVRMCMRVYVRVCGPCRCAVEYEHIKTTKVLLCVTYKSVYVQRMCVCREFCTYYQKGSRF